MSEKSSSSAASFLDLSAPLAALPRLPLAASAAGAAFADALVLTASLTAALTVVALSDAVVGFFSALVATAGALFFAGMQILDYELGSTTSPGVLRHEPAQAKATTVRFSGVQKLSVHAKARKPTPIQD